MKSITKLVISSIQVAVCLSVQNFNKGRQKGITSNTQGQPILINGDLERMDVLGLDSSYRFDLLQGNISMTIFPNPTKRVTISSQQCSPNKLSTHQLPKSPSGPLHTFLQHSLKDTTRSVYPLTWHYQTNNQKIYNVGSNLTLIKEEHYDTFFSQLLRFYNTSSGECFSLNLESNMTSLKYNTTLAQCKKMVNSLFLKRYVVYNSPYRLFNLFTGYMESFGVMRVIALQEKLIEPGWTFDLPGMEADNPLFVYKSWIQNFNYTVYFNRDNPPVLILLYERGPFKPQSVFRDPQKFVFVKSCKENGCFGDQSNQLPIPHTERQPKGQKNLTLLNIDCLMSFAESVAGLAMTGINSPELGKIEKIKFILNNMLYCVALYEGKNSTKQLTLMRAKIHGVDKNFTMVNSEISEANLIYVGFDDRPMSVLSYDNQRGRHVFFIYTDKIRVCLLTQADLSNLMVTNLFETFNKTCYTYEDISVAYNRSVEVISSVFLHKNSRFFDGSQYFSYPVKTWVVGMSIEFTPKNSSLTTKRVIRIPFYEKLRFPEIDISTQLWLTSFGRNMVLELVAGEGLRKSEVLIFSRSKQSTVDTPYFGLLKNSSNSTKKDPNEGKWNGRETQQILNINTQMKFSDGINPITTIWSSFAKLSLSLQNTTFSLLDENKTLFRMQNSSDYTNIFFSRPINCKGAKLVNFNHTHKDIFQIYLQPLKPLYTSLFPDLNWKRTNTSSSKQNQTATQKINSKENRIPDEKIEKINYLRENWMKNQRVVNSRGMNIGSETEERRRAKDKGSIERLIPNYVFSLENNKISGLIFTQGIELMIKAGLPQGLDLHLMKTTSFPSTVYLPLENVTGVQDGSTPSYRGAYLRNDFSGECLNLIIVRDFSLLSPAYDLNRWNFRSGYGRTQLPTSFYQTFLLESDLCHLNIKQVKNVSIRGWETSHQVNISIQDQLNKTHSISIMIERNDLQTKQSLNSTKKVEIKSISNFSSFNFYEHFHTQGSWFDLDLSLHPSGKLEAVADTVVHTFEDLEFANYVTKPKYPDSYNLTLIKAQQLDLEERQNWNDLIILEGYQRAFTIPSDLLTRLGESSLLQTPSLGQHKRVIASVLSDPTAYDFLYVPLEYAGYYNASLKEERESNQVRQLTLFSTLPRINSTGHNPGPLLKVLALTKDKNLNLYLLKGFPIIPYKYLGPAEYVPIGSGVVSFDYISSNKLADSYGYAIFFVDGRKLGYHGFSSGDYDLKQRVDILVDVLKLQQKLEKLDYLTYLKIYHNQETDNFDLIVDGDDQRVYVYRGQFQFSVVDVSIPSFNLTLLFNNTSDESYVKPMNMDSIECSTTKDFLICSSPVTYPEALNPHQNQYETLLMVWARRYGRFNGTGYTYRIETLGQIEPKGAFTIWNYSLNEIIMVKQYDHPKVVRLENKVMIGLKKSKNSTEKDSSFRLDDWDLELRGNRFTDSNYSIKIKGEDYLYVEFDLNYWLAAFLAIMALICSGCVWVCCYCYRMYRKIMGEDKKPRLRKNSYVESIRSEDEEAEANRYGDEEKMFA